MVLNPEVQAKAQEEIDAVLGPGTLPTMADKDRLPYINLLIMELLRWHPTVPSGMYTSNPCTRGSLWRIDSILLGVPHMCYQDDNYKGYEIEKGTIV